MGSRRAKDYGPTVPYVVKESLNAVLWHSQQAKGNFSVCVCVFRINEAGLLNSRGALDWEAGVGQLYSPFVPL